MQIKNIKLVNLPVSIFKEGKYFVAYSHALDLSTCGKNFDEAKNRFNEIAQIFFSEIIKNNTTDRVLEELGWHKFKTSWNPPTVVSHEIEEIKIPVGV